MIAPIDEQVAWKLVRAVRRVAADQPPPFYVFHDPSPDVWLQVRLSGQWDASAAVSDVACDLFNIFLPLQLPTELTIAQIGQSLDGRIATETGRSHYVTGRADIRRLHRLRASVDAIIVGAGTVAADNPRLTVREVDGENPVRVVLDPHGRLDKTRHVFSDGAAQTLHVRGQRAPSGPADGASRYDVLSLPVDAGFFTPETILQSLRDRGLRRVLIEGGGLTVSRFLQSGALDRLHVTVAPLIIGSGRPSITLDPIDTLDQALRPPCRCFRLGGDVLFDLDLREAAGRDTPAESSAPE